MIDRFRMTTDARNDHRKTQANQLLISIFIIRLEANKQRPLDYYKTKRCYSIPHIWQFPSVMAILGLFSISPDHAHAEMTCLSSAILSLISYDTPVVRTMNDAGQLIQIRTTVLHEQYRLNVSLTQTTVRQALQEFLSVTAGRSKGIPTDTKVSFCKAPKYSATALIITRTVFLLSNSDMKNYLITPSCSTCVNFHKNSIIKISQIPKCCWN